MFEQLQDRFESILKSIRGHGKITESNISDSMRDIRRALLEADVNFKVAKSFVERVKEKATGDVVLNSITPGQQFVKIIEKELAFTLGSEESDFNKILSKKIVLVLVGLQGCGKTTTAVKLAKLLKEKHNKTPFLIAADLQRPAAIEQLEVLGKQIEVSVYSDKNKQNAIEVVEFGLKEANKLDYDLIIIDTAGRLHIDDSLMVELKEIVEISNPNEIFYVADGMTGQDAVNSAEVFVNSINVSGIVLTKMDGDNRGGAALSVREVAGKPIRYVGVGESLDSIEYFYPERLAKRILGMGDIVSLVEKAQESLDVKTAEKLKKKIISNSFTLIDFKSQLGQIKNMGSLNQIVNLIPGTKKLKGINFNDRQLVWIEAMINSMTREERIRPEIINGSRRKRIAMGSGRSVQEVNKLLKQFFQMKIMMKKIGKMNKYKIPFSL